MTLSSTMLSVPHFLPYQGSKRKLASQIARYFPEKVSGLYEPFAGSMALSLYAARYDIANNFIIGDILQPLVELLEQVVNEPEKSAERYKQIWMEQGRTAEERIRYFYTIRESYKIDRDPIELLFLICRCVANAIRFNDRGHFTQSPDKRRKGTVPSRMRENIYGVSALLKGRSKFVSMDFTECITDATPNDLVYMDPPYQGTTEGRDKRYFKQLDRERLIKSLLLLDKKKVPYILSYDGKHGEKTYGEELPPTLNAEKFELIAGRSTQGTLNGKNVVTIESLYVSKLIYFSISENVERNLFIH